MRRQGPYADSVVNQMVAAHRQLLSGQRLQQNPGMGHFQGREDSLRADEEHQYSSSKAEGQRHWDRDGPKGSNPPPSNTYKEVGQGPDAPRSLYHGQWSDSKASPEKQGNNKDGRPQEHYDDMEVGYEDDTLPQTFEGLEQKFYEDITKITKEQEEAEDRENGRHRERLDAINGEYEEKLVAIRARQASHRDEFLRRESQARRQQYQRENMSSGGSLDVMHAYGSSASSAGAMADAHRAYAAAHYGEQMEFNRGGGPPRGHGQYPGGRAYNSGGRYYQ